nr:MAG TPA: hypothetical protein [Caudoviricetes sp.]
MSLARGIGLYTHIPSPPPRTCSAASGSYVSAPSGWGWQKKGAGNFM